MGIASNAKPVGQVTTNVSSSSRNNNKNKKLKNIPQTTQIFGKIRDIESKIAVNPPTKNVVKQLLSLKRTTSRPSVNLSKFLQQKGVSSDPSVELGFSFKLKVCKMLNKKPIDVESITMHQDATGKKTRRTRIKIKPKQLRNQYQIRNSTQYTKKQEEPAARRMGFGQGGGVANLGLQTITTEQPQNYTDFVLGRINTPIEKPKTITEEPEIIEVTQRNSF